MSVIVGISADCDFMLENAGYRVLMEIASERTDLQEDKRALEAGAWAHFLDLPSLDPAQAQRIAWLLERHFGRYGEIRAIEGSAEIADDQFDVDG